jgi:hypothetical protein
MVKSPFAEDSAIIAAETASLRQNYQRSSATVQLAAKPSALPGWAGNVIRPRACRRGTMSRLFLGRTFRATRQRSRRGSGGDSSGCEGSRRPRSRPCISGNCSGRCPSARSCRRSCGSGNPRSAPTLMDQLSIALLGSWGAVSERVCRSQRRPCGGLTLSESAVQATLRR